LQSKSRLQPLLIFPANRRKTTRFAPKMHPPELPAAATICKGLPRP